MTVNYKDFKNNEIIFAVKNPEYIPNINEKICIRCNSTNIIGFVIDKDIILYDFDKNCSGTIIDIIVKINS